VELSALAFDRYVERYDEWYEENREAYLSELKAVSAFLEEGLKLEVGVGTGRFAAPLGVDAGVDLSPRMLFLAKERGVEVVLADAAQLPFRGGIFDQVLFVVTICFLQSAEEAVKEAKRVLKVSGSLLVAFVPKHSEWGRLYAEKKAKGHPIYEHANFYSVEEVRALLERSGFTVESGASTLYQAPGEVASVEEPRAALDEGAGFVVVLARKQP